MKLHKDGTLEGTPQEIAEYNGLITSQKKSGISGIGASMDILKIQEDVYKNRQPWERPVAIL